MKIGIMTTGPMARKFVNTLVKLDEIELEAVGSRDINKAVAFKEEFGFNKAYGSYEELVKDEDVELIYIATPHSGHFDAMKLCIEHNKPVLCEKAFTVNAKQAKEIFELAKEKNVFVAEALWPRYQPSRKIINDILNSGIIGKQVILTANLSYDNHRIDRLTNPEKAGGSLLDIGVYGISFAFQVFGDEIEKIESSVKMTETGVDGSESITLFYKDGRMAILNHSIYCRGDRKGIIHGEKGYAVVENINNPSSISIYDSNDILIKKQDFPKLVSGYEYEALECAKCLKEGKIEPDSLSHKDSIKIMETMDEIRKQWGLKYPGE